MWDIGQDTPLSDDLKYLFTACKGQPIQDVLYNTGIYELPVENWTALSRQERYDLLFKCGAELYHYQSRGIWIRPSRGRVEISNCLSLQGAKPIFTMGRFDKMSYNVRYCGCKESAACAFLRGCIYIPERMCAIICDGVPEALSLRGEDDYF